MVEETSYKSMYMEDNALAPQEDISQTFGFTADYLSLSLDIKTLDAFYKGLSELHRSAPMLGSFNGRELIQNYIGAEMIRSKNLFDWQVIYNMDKRNLFEKTVGTGALHYRKSKQSHDLKSSLVIAKSEKALNSLTDRLSSRIENIPTHDFQRFKHSIMQRPSNRPANRKVMTREEYSSEIIQILRDSHPPSFKSHKDLTPQTLDYLRHNN